MALNATNFVNMGPIRSVDMRQFVDLFTGVMTDQPITFKNAMLVGGSQSASTPPLKLFGQTGQTGNLIELYPTAGSATATFGFGAVGNFAWGPGSPAANDTFLSRVALQNGHATDTAGILIEPYLEVKGNVKADGWMFANSASLTAPTGTPFVLVINQDLTINRYLTVGSTGPAGATIPIRVYAGGNTAGDTAGIHLYSQAGTLQAELWTDVLNVTTRLKSNGSISLHTGAGSTGFTATNERVVISNTGNVGIGTSPLAKLHTKGAAGVGWAAIANTTPTTINGAGGVLAINDSTSAGGEGGALLFGDTNHIAIAGIKSILQDGTSYGIGSLSFATRRATANTTLTEAFRIEYTGNIVTAADFSVGNILTVTAWANIPTIYLGTNHITQAGGDMWLRSVSGNIYIQNTGGGGGAVNLAAVNATGNVVGSSMASSGGYLYLGGAMNPSSSAHIIGSGNALYYRAAGHQLQNIAGGAADINVNSVIMPNGYAYAYISGQAMLSVGVPLNTGALTVGYGVPTGWAIFLNNTADSMGRGIANAWSLHSAAKYKTNVRALNDALDIVRDSRLHGHRYDNLNLRLPGQLHRTPGLPDTSPSVGFIAEDWLDILPEVVALDPKTDEPAGLDYDRIGAVTFEAVKQLDARVSELEARLAALEETA